MTDTTDQYRFETGKLYKYSKEQNSYIFIYMNARHNTEKRAIAAYERDEMLNPS